ncbi:MAG: carbonic anhydrase, partial [Syntrophomonadaceae bacterium]|nr:carbonic anhydrase [Syntrophomonadaceae bacterium]
MLSHNPVKNLVSPTQARQRLVDGNQRFVNENYGAKELGFSRRMTLLKEGQFPFAVIFTCSDSRVPPEIIFDQALGDIFVIRTAGNVLDDVAMGSVEYAVDHLHTPLV